VLVNPAHLRLGLPPLELPRQEPMLLLLGSTAPDFCRLKALRLPMPAELL
jgi:hypothetical protein